MFICVLPIGLTKKGDPKTDGMTLLKKPDLGWGTFRSHLFVGAEFDLRMIQNYRRKIDTRIKVV